jgi:hypothetical protein
VLVFVRTYARRRTPRRATVELAFSVPRPRVNSNPRCRPLIVTRQAPFLTVIFYSQDGVPAV